MSLPGNRPSTETKSIVKLAIWLACMAGLAAGIAVGGTSPSFAGATPNARESVAAHSSQTHKPASAKEMDLIDLDGYHKLVASHRGKPLLVTFWATWCEPCRDEYPLVNRLAQQYASQGLDVVGVDMDDDAEMTLVHHFLDHNQPIFPNVRKKMGHEDAFENGVDPRWKGTMPANFFYTADGQLAGFMVGEHPRDDFEQIIRVILAARGGASSHP